MAIAFAHPQYGQKKFLAGSSQICQFLEIHGTGLEEPASGTVPR